MLTKRKIGVLMGGTSAEREVSLRGGQAVYNALKTLGYNVEAIDVGIDVCEVLKKEKIEIAFIVLHGGTGEDGSIQGLLEVTGIPYTGSGVLASALAMDKSISKKVFLQSGVKVPKSETVYSVESGLKALETLSLPLVVKPSREGSSIGVSIVKNKGEIKDAIMAALSFCGPVVIEEFVKGKEVQIGVLGGRALGGVEVRPSLEFYNYEAKYTPGLTQYILPPEIPKDVYEKAEEMAVRAHNALGCSGATRVDLIVDDKGSPFVLEVNTIPGMTETSLLPKIAKMAGLDFPALIEEILKETLQDNKVREGF